MFVSDMIGGIVFAYSVTDRVMVLYVICSISLYAPKLVVANAFMIFSVLLTLLLAIFYMCSSYLSFFLSKVRPSIFGSCATGSVLIYILSRGLWLHSAGSGAK